MNLTFGVATEANAASLAGLQNRVAEHLTGVFGQGHWSHCVSEEGVLRNLKCSRVLVARDGVVVVGTLRLATKKPWAIDPAYFRPVRRPLYLLGMAVEPSLQRRGIGRRLLAEATAAAKAWPSEAIRLDAYDSNAGAGGFYAKCGYSEVGRVVYRNTPLIYYEFLL